MNPKINYNRPCIGYGEFEGKCHYVTVDNPLKQGFLRRKVRSRIMQNYYYQVLIDGKVFPYEGCKIWNKESAEVYLKQAETIVKTHVDYKYKNCKVELVRMERGVIEDE